MSLTVESQGFGSTYEGRTLRWLQPPTHTPDVTWMEPTNTRTTLGQARSGCVTRLPKIAPTSWDVTSLNTPACQVFYPPYIMILGGVHVTRKGRFLHLSSSSSLFTFMFSFLLYLTYSVTVTLLTFIKGVLGRTSAGIPAVLTSGFWLFLCFSGLMPGTSHHRTTAPF
jgi:hypothetical protein